MRVLLAIVVAILMLCGVILGRTLQVPKFATPTHPDHAGPELDADAALTRLAQALRIASISRDTQATDLKPFQDLHSLLLRQFPLVHAKLDREVIAGGSLLYRWAGADTAAKPVLLLGHLDVVPAVASAWEEAPFSGAMREDFLYGRGALDDKGSIWAMMEAVSALLQQGVQPQRTIYFAFGHDEEVGGNHGARVIAQRLAEQQLQFAFILDEGGVIVDGATLGVDRKVALIGVAEKGYANLRLRVEAKGGHSSMPPPRGAIGILAAAIERLNTNPFPPRITAPLQGMLQGMAPALPFVTRMAVSNQWLFQPIIEGIFLDSPTTAAFLRTSHSVNIISGGNKSNVLPQAAQAIVNLRLLPGDEMEWARDYVAEVIADERVQVELLKDDANNAPEPGKVDSAGFAMVREAVETLGPEILPLPYLVPGGTDSKHYAAMGDTVLRFLYLYLSEADIDRMHGRNERISWEQYRDLIRFYHFLLGKL